MDRLQQVHHDVFHIVIPEIISSLFLVDLLLIVIVYYYYYFILFQYADYYTPKTQISYVLDISQIDAV